MLYHPGTDEITDTCGNKGKQHLHRSPPRRNVKAPHASAAATPSFQGRIERMNLFYFIQTFVDSPLPSAVSRSSESFYKLLHPIKFGCIDPCIGYT